MLDIELKDAPPLPAATRQRCAGVPWARLPRETRRGALARLPAAVAAAAHARPHPAKVREMSFPAPIAQGAVGGKRARARTLGAVPPAAAEGGASGRRPTIVSQIFDKYLWSRLQWPRRLPLQGRAGLPRWSRSRQPLLQRVGNVPRAAASNRDACALLAEARRQCFP